MNSRLIAIAVSIGFVLLALSAFANWPLSEVGTIPNNSPEPGSLLVIGLVLAGAGMRIRNHSASNIRSDTASNRVASIVHNTFPAGD